MNIDKLKDDVDIIIDSTVVKEFIKRAVIENGVDYVKLAEKCGMSHTKINNYMNKHFQSITHASHPTHKQLLMIMRELGAVINVNIVINKDHVVDKAIIKDKLRLL